MTTYVAIYAGCAVSDWKSNYDMGRNNPTGFGPAPTGDMARDVQNWAAFNQGAGDAPRVASTDASDGGTYLNADGNGATKPFYTKAWIPISAIAIGTVIAQFVKNNEVAEFGGLLMAIGIIALAYRYFKIVVALGIVAVGLYMWMHR